MIEQFAEALKKTKDIYDKTLTSFDPTNHTNKEANLTSFFLQAIHQVKNPLSNAVSYDEFPVDKKFRPGKSGDEKSDCIDSVIYLPEENRLFIFEAKEALHPGNSIAWDILRANNVANTYEVFPFALRKSKRERLLVDYSNTKVFGLVLCGFWSQGKNGPIKDEFVGCLRKANDPSLTLSGHFVDEKEIIIEEVPLVREKWIDLGWKYYLVLYLWPIKKAFSFPKYGVVDPDEAAAEIPAFLAEIAMENPNRYYVPQKRKNASPQFEYLYPKDLIDMGLINFEYANSELALWVYKDYGVYETKLKLWAKRPNGNFVLPDCFGKDIAEENNRFWSVTIGELAALFDEAGRAELRNKLNGIVQEIIGMNKP